MVGIKLLTAICLFIWVPEVEAEINQSQSDVCLEPKTVGPCKAHIKRFYFDQEANRCKRFNYGGCKGNANNFETKRKCMTTCPPRQADVCLEPKKVGPCEALIKRFYFDQEKGRCKRFDYGGCEGNGNNFETKGKCMKACPPKQVNSCLQPKKVGPCKAAFPRFFYNQETEQCESFIWGGCQANGNNFKNMFQCKKKCLSQVSPCEQPKKVGPCYAIKPRFYYNQETGQCESFDWGGCQPNGNNFETIGICEAMCLGQGSGCRPLKRKPEC